MYKYYQLTYLVLIGEFDQKSNFHPWLGKLGHIKAEGAQTGKKSGY